MQIDYAATISPVISHNVDYVTSGTSTYGGSTIKWNVMGVAVLIAGTACGNLLVCIAVCRERSLHNMANYFLMSLAIADLLVSVFVMPIGLTILLFGKAVV
jgi:7 transmembrane receptor (rhodopsin family)